MTYTALFGLSLSTSASAADVTKLVEPCFACHGKEGVSTEANIPSIASYSEDYISSTMKKFQKKIRPCIETEIRSGSKKGTKTDMCKIAAGLSESDIGQIGEYFVAQTFVRTPQVFDAELANKGKSIHKRKCDTCHTESGTVSSDHAGILGGQKMAYLRAQIKSFKDGTRPMSAKMKPKLESLDDNEIEAVINYYGSVQ
ncbi:MAG: c-type cytochrome [Sideroxydans sp.]|nr:c-type cytochrome [Sideroxydans sp.]